MFCSSCCCCGYCCCPPSASITAPMLICVIFLLLFFTPILILNLVFIRILTLILFLIFTFTLFFFLIFIHNRLAQFLSIWLNSAAHPLDSGSSLPASPVGMGASCIRELRCHWWRTPRRGCRFAPTAFQACFQ